MLIKERTHEEWTMLFSQKNKNIKSLETENFNLRMDNDKLSKLIKEREKEFLGAERSIRELKELVERLFKAMKE